MKRRPAFRCLSPYVSPVQRLFSMRQAQTTRNSSSQRVVLAWLGLCLVLSSLPILFGGQAASGKTPAGLLRQLRSGTDVRDVPPVNALHRAATANHLNNRVKLVTAMAMTLYVDDTLLITTDTGPAGLSAGDTVTFANGEVGQTGGLTFGTNAFDTLGAAIAAATSGDTVLVAAGTYNTPQVLIDKALTVQGAGAAVTFINGGNTPIPAIGLVRINLPETDTGNVLFAGFTVTNPGLTGSSRYHMFGKQLSPASVITISNNKLTGVNASDYGFYTDRPRGKIVFDHNELTNNAFNPILIERPQGETDFHHNTISGHGSTAYFSFTYSGNDVTGKQRVADNTITGSAATAISLNGASPIGGGFGKYSSVEITNNVITQLGTNRFGISLSNGASTGNGPLGAIENPLITGNSISGTDLAGSKGIRLAGQITNATIKSNNIRDVDRGVSGEVTNGHSATGAEVHFNNLVSNLNGLFWDGTAAVNAENNWWGCNFGPGLGGVGCSGTANGISGAGAANVDANPWLTLTFTATPPTVMQFGMTTLAAMLTINSDGVDTAPMAMFVPGTSASFTQGGLGTVAPSNATTSNGVANATYTAGGATGSDSLATTVDGQTVTTGVVITCQTITLVPPALSAGTAGTAYPNTQFSASGGSGPHMFTLMSGVLPNGLTLSNSGLLSGTPLQAGTFNLVIKATDNSGCAGTQAYTLVINCPVISIMPSTLPNATVNTAYPQTLTASPAGGNYTYAVTSGLLPTGLTLNSNGSFSGAPTQSGTFNFRVTATGFGACSGFRDYVLVVLCPAITLAPATLPSGTIWTAYNQSVSASPAGVYSYSVTSGALPSGLTLNSATGALTGTPSTSGTYNFTVTAAAGLCSGSQSYTVTIGCAALTLGPPALPSAQAGTAYSQTLSVSPAGSYTFSLLTGNLPPGLLLNAATGTLSGTATATGTYSFTVQVLSVGGCTATQAYTLVVTCPTVTVNPATLPNGTTGTAYNQTVSATPSGSYSFAKTSGTLPPGLTLNSAGSLSGTPTTAGTYSFTVTATGFGTCPGSRSYTVTIAASCATITLPALPTTGTVNVNYNGNLAATTPSGTYTFTVESGALPPGLTINNLFGTLSGKPTTMGTYTFTLKATRSNGCTGMQPYTVVINGGALVALARTADYDGDGKSDLSLWTAGSGRWQILRSRDEQTTQTAWGGAGDVTLLGDYDGDGQSDLAVFRPSNGTWYVKQSSDGTALVKAWGGVTDVPVPGDYDGDGKTDVAVWRPSEGNWYVLKSSDGSYAVTAWGLGRAPYLDVPVPGDYDGDGKTDLAVFRRQTGTWLIRRSSDGQVISKAWGGASDVPVVGDYDGDGKSDLAIWRGTTGEWFVLRSSDQTYTVNAWGAASVGDVPAPGDYDGDGKTDLAVWRGPEGKWYVRQSSDAAIRTAAHGALGDRVVPSR